MPLAVSRPLSATTASIFAALLAFSSAPASAQSLEDMQRQLDALQAQVKSLQAQMEAAKKAAAEKAEAEKAEAEALKAAGAKAAGAKADKEGVSVAWKGGPEISSADGANRMKVRGRVVIDAGFGDQDQAVTGHANLNATEFRAARLGVEGVMARDFTYVLEAEFSGDHAQLVLGSVGYKGLPADINVGLMKTGNSLEELTSLRYITFMERSAITDSFGLAQQIGVMVSKKTSLWTLQSGIFRGTNGTADTNEGVTLTARATVAPHIGDMGLLHLGAHVRYREVGSGQSLLGYSQRPHLHLAAKTLSVSGFADSDTLIGGEAAFIRGPFSLQGEYMRLHANNADPTGPNADFSGYYIDATWFLTGESRPYSKGTFGRVPVNRPITDGGPGAWELAARFDTVDLTDGPFMGGSQDSYIFGVNWYLTNHVRMMANYNNSRVHGGAYDGADINLFGLRGQLDW